MEDRITVLERNINQLIVAVERIGIRQIAINASFARLVGPILAGAGVTQEEIRRVRDGMGGGALWMALAEAGPERSDHLTRSVSEELASILEAVAEQAELALKAKGTLP